MNEIDKTQQEGVPAGIFKDMFGKLYWEYDLSFWKNPAILITVLRVMWLSSFICAFIVSIFQIGDGFGKAVGFFFKLGILMCAGMSVLALLGYALYALIMGGKYCVVFEMDETGVNHIQVASQFKKAQVLSALTVMAGLAGGKLTVVGSGLLAGSRQAMRTNFAANVKVEGNKNRETIYLTDGLFHNQVYADKQQFDYVLNYIQEHCK